MQKDLWVLLSIGALSGCAAATAPPVMAPEPPNAVIAFGVRQEPAARFFGPQTFDGDIKFGFWRLNDDGTPQISGDNVTTITAGCDATDTKRCAHALVFHFAPVPAGQYALAFYSDGFSGHQLAPSAGVDIHHGAYLPCLDDDQRLNGAAVWTVAPGRTTYLGVVQLPMRTPHGVPQLLASTDDDMRAFQADLRTYQQAPQTVDLRITPRKLRIYGSEYECMSVPHPGGRQGDPGLRVGGGKSG